MEPESAYFLSLLGSFLREEPPSAAEVRWDRLFELARSQNVLGILGYLTRQAPICPDPAIQQALQQIFHGTVASLVQRTALADALLEGLTDQGIDHIVMKGYVVRSYYPVPDLRTYGDIDLVLRPGDQQRAHDWMLSQGFTPKVDWGPVMSYVRGQEFYELHTDIMEVPVSDRADCRGYFRSMWDHVQLQRGRTYEFTPEYHYLFLLTHLAKHLRRCGAGARMYLDLGAFCRHFGETLDWAWIRQELHTLQLWEFASTASAAVERWFGIPAPIPFDPVPAETLAALADFTLEAGIFGKEGREEGLNTLRQEERSKLAVLRDRLFPGAAQIETRYTYLKERPWLLPAAWIDRLVKNRGALRDRAREARGILTADQQEVSRQQALMHDIGL